MQTVKTVSHTPGPWTFEPGDGGDPSVGLAPTPPVVFVTIPNREDRSIDIATIGTTIYDNSEDGYPQSWGDPDANGRLISAAPDLLAVAKAVYYKAAGLLNGTRVGQELVDALGDAISKAEGR